MSNLVTEYLADADRRKDRAEAREAAPRSFSDWLRVPAAVVPADLSREKWEEWGRGLLAKRDVLAQEGQAWGWKVIQWMEHGEKKGYSETYKEAMRITGKSYNYLQKLMSIGKRTFSNRLLNPAFYKLPPASVEPIAELPEEHQPIALREAIKTGQTTRRKIRRFTEAYELRAGLKRPAAADVKIEAEFKQPLVVSGALQAEIEEKAAAAGLEPLEFLSRLVTASRL